MVSDQLRHILAQYRWLFSDLAFVRAVMVAGVLLFVGSTLNVIANVYATHSASNSVTDIVLSNTRAYNVDNFFVYGTFVLTLFTLLVVLLRPNYFPFVGASLGLFYCIRTCFVSLTHIGPFPDRAVLDLGSFMQKVLGGGDMFFSGHTGAPFLLALIFWSVPALRYIFLAWSGFFAVVVLLGHLHYTIDVAAAFFITFTIFHIAEFLFPAYRSIF